MAPSGVERLPMRTITSGLNAAATLVLCALAASCGSSGGTPGESGDASSPTDGSQGDKTEASAGTDKDGHVGSPEDAHASGKTDGSAGAHFGQDAFSPDDAFLANDASLTDAPEASTDNDGSMSTSPPPGSIDLGTAADYVILSETGISTVSPSTITGNLGVSPAAATYITGFSLILNSSGRFSTSAQVSGRVYAADYASPTPSDLTTAISDMKTAFTAAAGRAPTVTGLGAGSIGGMTLTAGVYGWGTGLLMATNVTLSGTATDVWIFQVAKGLTVSDGAHLVLSGGALPKNVYWQVSGAVSLGTTAQFDGIILCQTGIALATGASITGSLLAQTAVTLDANAVVSSP
jgi:Ice-binding-like